MSDDINQEENDIMTAVLLWIEGNTGVKYMIAERKTAPKEDLISVSLFSNVIPMRDRSPLSMPIRSHRIIINMMVHPKSGAIVHNKGLIRVTVQFIMNMQDNSQNHHTMNFEFMGRNLYHVG